MLFLVFSIFSLSNVFCVDEISVGNTNIFFDREPLNLENTEKTSTAEQLSTNEEYFEYYDLSLKRQTSRFSFDKEDTANEGFYFNHSRITRNRRFIKSNNHKFKFTRK